MDEIDFLGHTLTPKGVKPSASKTKAIDEMPAPKSLSELQSFLGMAG